MKMTHKGIIWASKPHIRLVRYALWIFTVVDNGKIHENWVMLDYVDLFSQMGVNLLPNDVVCLKK